MKKPDCILAAGTKIRTHAELEPTTGMMFSARHLEARRPNAEGAIHGVAQGHGGDVYFVDHASGDGSHFAPYCFTEFELLEKPVEPSWQGGRFTDQRDSTIIELEKQLAERTNRATALEEMLEGAKQNGAALLHALRAAEATNKALCEGRAGIELLNVRMSGLESSIESAKQYGADALARVAKGVPRSLRSLQTDLPWTVHYHRDFRSSPMSHKDFGHALLHVQKAAGKLAAVVNDAEHGGSEFLAKDVDPYVADLVVCALRMANTCPGRTFDLQSAVEDRIRTKNAKEEAKGGTIFESYEARQSRQNRAPE